jgi:hypothetical protein
MRAISLGEFRLISGRSSAINADIAIATISATVSIAMIDPVPESGVTPRKYAVQRVANVPYMKTSEWAKLISWSTPYTIV